MKLVVSMSSIVIILKLEDYDDLYSSLLFTMFMN